MKKLLVMVCVACMLLSVGNALATPITGDPVGNAFSWTAPSTNALNYAKEVPGRVGQSAPYVLFNSNDVGSVTLDFFNFAPGGVWFEYRIDGVATRLNPPAHPVVIGDTIHFTKALGSNTDLLGVQFLANEFVDIRLALGGERDWDFDWTRFDAAPVPEPGTLLLLGGGLAGLVIYRRKQKKA